MTKRSRKKEKNISNQTGHSNSLNKVVRPLTAETNRTMKIIICIFLVLSTFAVYWQVQDYKFINFDDDVYITDNLNVKAGLTKESVMWAFTTTYYLNWHPMTWLSYMLDYQLYGLHPKGYHLTNLFFHIANALLLFVVLFRMTGALWQSSFVAVMFALHPINIQSVAWLAERKNVLSTFFWLLTTWTYTSYVQKRNLTRYSMVVLFFMLGLMSKPMLVTLPFVFLLLDYWPLKRLEITHAKKIILAETENQIENKKKFLNLFFEKIPLLVLAVGSSVVTFLAQKSGEAVVSLRAVALTERINNALVSYLEYLGKVVWTKDFSVFYPYPVNLPVWKGLMSGLVLTGITILAVRLIKKTPYLAVGWFWYLGTLVPVIGIVQVGGQAMADRYAYIPLIGIFIIIAWGVPELISKWRYKEKVLSVSAGIIIPILMITTWWQVSHWKNSITIFKHAIRVTDKKHPGLALIHNNLGIALFAEQKNEEAISHYKMAIKLMPTFAKAYNNLGNALFDKGKIEEAIYQYKMSIKLKPNYADTHYNLGYALFDKGKIEEAIYQYKMAIKLKPNYAKAYNNLGNVLFDKGKIEEAIYQYKIAINLKPNYTDAHYNLGHALFDKGRIEEAIYQYKMAIKLKPDFAKGHNNLGLALFAEQKIEEAIIHYKMAIKLNPNYSKTHYNLGRALVAMHETEEAISHYKMAIKLSPDFAEAHYNLGTVLFNAKMTEEAIDCYKEAIRIQPDFALAHNNLGNALFQKGAIKEAIGHYRETLRLRPDLVSVRKNLEMVLLRLEEYEHK